MSWVGCGGECDGIQSDQIGLEKKGERTAPQEPQALAAPSEAAPHLGQLDPCMLDLGCGVFVAVRG